jgi:hypothetical protein
MPGARPGLAVTYCMYRTLRRPSLPPVRTSVLSASVAMLRTAPACTGWVTRHGRLASHMHLLGYVRRCWASNEWEQENEHAWLAVDLGHVAARLQRVLVDGAVRVANERVVPAC